MRSLSTAEIDRARWVESLSPPKSQVIRLVCYTIKFLNFRSGKKNKDKVSQCCEICWEFCQNLSAKNLDKYCLTIAKSVRGGVLRHPIAHWIGIQNLECLNSLFSIRIEYKLKSMWTNIVNIRVTWDFKTLNYLFNKIIIRKNKVGLFSKVLKLYF